MIGLPVIAASYSCIMATAAVCLQGNCTGPPSADIIGRSDAPLQPLLPQQCMLVVDKPLLQTTDSFLWISGLYLRFAGAADGTQLPWPLLDLYDSQVLVTQLAVQGESGTECLVHSCVLRSHGGAVLVEGVIAS